MFDYAKANDTMLYLYLIMFCNNLIKLDFTNQSFINLPISPILISNLDTSRLFSFAPVPLGRARKKSFNSKTIGDFSNQSGVYLFLNAKQTSILYVGSTNNFNTRFNLHYHETRHSTDICHNYAPPHPHSPLF